MVMWVDPVLEPQFLQPLGEVVKILPCSNRYWGRASPAACLTLRCLGAVLESNVAGHEGKKYNSRVSPDLLW